MRSGSAGVSNAMRPQASKASAQRLALVMSHQATDDDNEDGDDLSTNVKFHFLLSLTLIFLPIKKLQYLFNDWLQVRLAATNSFSPKYWQPRSRILTATYDPEVPGASNSYGIDLRIL
ncbi:hypothetical protein DM860_016945 [Cuscuta australis]|uniref:Uncharacterized protein n=1 Tax=Cuscuta australis TaxID=267555 RepID=A0A328E123_9ASTE|nr:hypothetical protein DM860_016945 [Cuscuta australis]